MAIYEIDQGIDDIDGDPVLENCIGKDITFLGEEIRAVLAELPEVDFAGVEHPIS